MPALAWIGAPFSSMLRSPCPLDAYPGSVLVNVCTDYGSCRQEWCRNKQKESGVDKSTPLSHQGLLLVGSWSWSWRRSSLLRVARSISLASTAELSSIGTHLLNRERKKSHFSSSSNCFSNHSLLTSSISALSARNNLASIVEKTSEDVDFLIVDGIDLVSGQVADFASSLATKARTTLNRILVRSRDGQSIGPVVVLTALRLLCFFAHSFLFLPEAFARADLQV